MTCWFSRCLVLGAMVGGLSVGSVGQALAQEAAATPAREVAPERMMTLQERAAVRERMQNAQTPQEREAIMTETMGKMRQRAAQNGAVLAENGGPRMRNGNGNGEMAAEAGVGRSEMAPRAENGPGKTMRPRPPAAP